MKKNLLVVLFALSVSISNASEPAKLQIKISSIHNKKAVYVCINNAGCINLYAANHGMKFPINPGEISYILPMTTTNFRLNKSVLPAHCQLTVKSNQTVIISGKLETNANDETYINHLDCRVI